MAQLGLSAFQRGSSGFLVCHPGCAPHIDPGFITTEFYGQAVGVPGVDGQDKAVVNNAGYGKSSGCQFIHEFPQLVAILDAKGDVVENDWTGHRIPVVFFLHFFDIGPLEKSQEVIGRNFEEIVAITRLSQTGYEPHAQKIPPEAYGEVHITGYHGQMVDAFEFDHTLKYPHTGLKNQS